MLARAARRASTRHNRPLRNRPAEILDTGRIKGEPSSADVRCLLDRERIVNQIIESYGSDAPAAFYRSWQTLRMPVKLMMGCGNLKVLPPGRLGIAGDAPIAPPREVTSRRWERG
jgi:hypothetical protein